LTDNLERRTTSFRLVYCFVALIALVGGIMIYVFFRHNDNITLFRHFLKPIFLNTLYIPIKTDTMLGYFFVFNFPHGLWCLSGLFIIRAIWLTNTKWRVIYGSIFIALIFFLEISKLSRFRAGTFDVLDLLTYGIFAFVESIIYNQFIRRKFL
jgi:hypothetical protein